MTSWRASLQHIYHNKYASTATISSTMAEGVPGPRGLSVRTSFEAHQKTCG